MIDDAITDMISSFGEEVTVIPKSTREVDDADNPIYFEESEEDTDSYTERVRMYTAVSNEELREYGFDDRGEAMIYNDNGNIGIGDTVKYRDDLYEWIVDDVATNQVGNGPYVWMYSLVSK